MECPKCGFNQADANESCGMCGVIFARLNDETAPEPQGPSNAPVIQPLERTDWITLGIGLGVGVIFLKVGMLRFVLSYLFILIHEFGHAVIGWLFAYPSIPRFDFYYGGGICTYEGRSAFIYVVLALLYAVLIYTLRKNRFALIVIAVFTVIYIPVALTGAHMALFLFMGHGTELVFAGIFLFRAMTGSAIIHAAEKPLYAACGFFIILRNMAFGYGLMTDLGARYVYAQQKGGGHVGDFDRIAMDYLHVSLESVAFVFFLCCFLPLILSFLAALYRQYISAAVTGFTAEKM